MKQNIVYDKPFKTYSELIDIMKSRNIIINDVEFATKVLDGLSYYTIVNGYKNSFLLLPGSDKFVSGTKFEDLYTLHTIDTSLNSIILKYILYVEKYLKTRIAYQISFHHGVFSDFNDLTNTNKKDYLCRYHYSSSKGPKNNVLVSLKEIVHKENVNTIISHYANDKNHIPAWILLTGVPFGLAIEWYNIMTASDKDIIVNKFIPNNSIILEHKKEFLTKAFALLKEFRNRIAHGNRTFTINNLPVLPKQQLLILADGSLSEKEYNQGFGKNDLFAVILLILFLIDDKYILHNLRADLHAILSEYKDIRLNDKSINEIFRLPDNIFDRIDNIFKKRKYV